MRRHLNVAGPQPCRDSEILEGGSDLVLAEAVGHVYRDRREVSPVVDGKLLNFDAAGAADHEQYILTVDQNGEIALMAKRDLLLNKDHLDLVLSDRHLE